MYGRGMTISEINAHLEEIDNWKNRQLQKCYPFVFMDAIHFSIKSNEKILNRAVYVVLGIDLEGKKDILSIVVGENESSKFWLKVVDELRSKGIEDIFTVSIDGLKGFSDAILTIYPETKIQRFMVHQIRDILKYINY